MQIKIIYRWIFKIILKIILGEAINRLKKDLKFFYIIFSEAFEILYYWPPLTPPRKVGAGSNDSRGDYKEVFQKLLSMLIGIAKQL